MALSPRLLWINLLALTVNALLFCALTFRLWPPVLIVAAGVQCLLGLIRLSWTIQHQRMGPAQNKARFFRQKHSNPVVGRTPIIQVRGLPWRTR